MLFRKVTDKMIDKAIIEDKAADLLDYFSNAYNRYNFIINNDMADCEATCSDGGQVNTIFVGMKNFYAAEKDGKIPISAYIGLCHDLCHEVSHIQQFENIYKGVIYPAYMKETALDIIIESRVPEYKWAIYKDCPKEQYAEWSGLKLFSKIARNDSFLKEHNIDYKTVMTDYINNYSEWYADFPVKSLNDAITKLDNCLFNKTDADRRFDRTALYNAEAMYGSIASSKGSVLKDILRFSAIKEEIDLHDTKNHLSNAILKGLYLLDKDFLKQISDYIPNRLSFLIHDNESKRIVDDSSIQYDNQDTDDYHL